MISGSGNESKRNVEILRLKAIEEKEKLQKSIARRIRGSDAARLWRCAEEEGTMVSH